jgi:hypothetical protein
MKISKIIFVILLVYFIPVNTFANCIEGDCQNGNGTWKYINHKKYDKYVGAFKNNLPDGKGKTIYKDGLREFVGLYKNGNIHGHGTFTAKYKNGNIQVIYEGEVKEGNIHGHGTFTGKYKNGNIEYTYEGDLEKGSFHGHGRYERFDKNGRTSEVSKGQFKNNQIHNGLAVFYKNGTIEHTYEGEWKEGSAHGYGKREQFDKNGNIIIAEEGIFSKGNFVRAEKKDVDENKSKKNTIFKGFRGVKWLSSTDWLNSQPSKLFSGCGSYEFVSESGLPSGKAGFSKPKENLSLGDVQLNRVIYWFEMYSEKFDQVTITFKSSDTNNNKVYDILVKSLGQKKPKKRGNKYIWDIPPLKVVLNTKFNFKLTKIQVFPFFTSKDSSKLDIQYIIKDKKQKSSGGTL